MQLCFPSKRSMNVKFSKKKRKKERKRTPSYAVLSLPFSNPTHSLSSCLHFPVFPYVCPFFSAPSLSHSQYRTKLITSFQQRQKGPSLVDPLSRHVVFSQWQLNYIFMATQIRHSCSNTQTRHSAKTPNIHLLVVCLPSRNCSSKREQHICGSVSPHIRLFEGGTLV